MNLPRAPEDSSAAAQAETPPPDVTDLGKLVEPVILRSIAVTGIFILLVLYTLKLASSFLVPVVLAILINFVFAAALRTLNRFYVPVPVGAALVMALLLGSLGFAIYQLAGPARDWMVKLPQTARQIERKIKDVRQSVEQVTKATQEVDRLTTFDTGDKTQKVEVRKATLGETLLAPTQDFLVSAGIFFILLFFLLASGDSFLRKAVIVLPRFSDKKIAVEISRQIEHDISTYLWAITAINALFGAAVAASMYFLGMPNPILWGVMAGLLHFIPFLGALVGISIVTMVAAVTLEGLNAILLVPAVYFALNLLEEYVILPLVMGRRLMLNPVAVFLWLTFWGWMWGVPGALMAVPLLAVVKIICDHFERLAALSEFIGR